MEGTLVQRSTYGQIENYCAILVVGPTAVVSRGVLHVTSTVVGPTMIIVIHHPLRQKMCFPAVSYEYVLIRNNTKRYSLI